MLKDRDDRDTGKGPKGRPILTDEFVDEIIAAKKLIPKSTKNPFKTTEKNGNNRASIELICHPYGLRMGIRQTIDDALDFSVLLIYTDANGRTYILRRYNGDHGKHTDPITSHELWGPHIHRITEECQKTIHKDEGHAEATNRYQTLDQAIDVFMNDMNISHEQNKYLTKLTDGRW